MTVETFDPLSLPILSDEEFLARWPVLTKQDRAELTPAIRKACFERYNRLMGPVASTPSERADEGPQAPAVADFCDPVRAAWSIVASFYTTPHGLRTLHFWQGEFHLWTGSHYQVLPLPDVRELLYRIGPTCSKAPVKRTHVDNVLDALRAAANLSHRKIPTVPAWIDTVPGDPPAHSLIPLANGLLRIEDQALLPASPRLFVPYSLPFEFPETIEAPLTWLRFLASVWPDDRESIDCLQEWLGYLLTADTSQQKALMIVGPKRSGKGTIGRIIVRLLGQGNVASPTLASLGSQFGLQVLIGKTAALVSDARLGGKADIAAIAENVLRLTGEDEISVERKFQTAFTARLLARLVVLGNEVPTFRDAASALPSRFVVLRTTRSFFGEEDLALESRLVAELPGILVWALQGLRRLRERGRFVQPRASQDALQLMEELASPIGSFLRDRCVFADDAWVSVKALYQEWKDWCKDHGRDQPGTEMMFGRDVAAAAPQVRVTRPRKDNPQRERRYEGIRLREASDKHPDDQDGLQSDDDDLPI